MRPTFHLVAVGVCALALGLPVSRAAEFNMKVTTEDINLGRHVAGPELTKDDLKHRVVFVEFWGIH